MKLCEDISLLPATFKGAVVKIVAECEPQRCAMKWIHGKLITVKLKSVDYDGFIIGKSKTRKDAQLKR